MQQPVVSRPDRKELEKLIRLFCLKSAQVIVQGRLGTPISSKCNSTSGGGDKFNLAIKDYPEVQKEAKIALTDGSPMFHSKFVIEISLRTSDGESLVLEIWSLSISRRFEDARIFQAVYRKMSMLLKSLACISRSTPAYKLSRNQGREYVNCFRIYTGKADLSELGESSKTMCIGIIGTPIGTLSQSVAFRSSENLYLSTKKFVSEQPIDLSHNYFSHSTSSGHVSTSSARPCNTLQSRLMGSKGMLSVSGSSNEQMESPTYYVQQSPGTPSPNNPYATGSRNRAAMFTIGTPPAVQSVGRTLPQTSSNSGRKMSDVAFDRMPFYKSQKPFLNSTSEQNFSYPLHMDHSRRRLEMDSHAGSMQDQRDTRKQQLHDDIIKDASMHSTLTNGDSSFRPISQSPSSHSQSSSIDKVQSNPNSLARTGNMRKSNLESVTALKSSSPTNAKIGFPDNIELNSKQPLLHPSEDGRRMDFSKKPRETSKAVRTTTIPMVGAFVSNTGKVKKMYDILTEDPSKQTFPFDDLLSQGERNGICNIGSRTVSNPGSVDSSISSSSSSSTGSAPSKGKNPAFSRNYSAKDSSAFYREIENAPDLVMFQENNGEETQETLLELTKQLEDYQRDAADFDDFIQELGAY